MELVKIEEHRVEGKPLGRHILHDPRSLEFRAVTWLETLLNLVADRKFIEHPRACPAFDQGDLSSCTGNAIAGSLMTAPDFRPHRSYNEVTAVALWSLATHLDPVDGQSYPPNNVGSSGVDVCKAAQAKGYIRQYYHCFGLHEATTVLFYKPILIGSNWYDSMDQPNAQGGISISPDAAVRGGHEYYLSGIDAQSKIVKGWNSWGTDWGDQGAFYMTMDTLDRLLGEQGDATVPIV